ncbi:MAG: sulfatase [bacterium]
MRILYLDLDTLRPDHLGCYGYHRNTSPQIDRIAAEGVRFENYYCSDAPCLPSRAALLTARHGIHNGVINHGGACADRPPDGANRSFCDSLAGGGSLFHLLRSAGLRCTHVGGFGERHSAYWWYAGVHEVLDTGKGGMESAEEITPVALDWIRRHAKEENWYLHVNYWDPHTPYRAPASFGNPFADEPLPAWLTSEVFDGHRNHVGPHGALEMAMYDDSTRPQYPRHPGKITDLDGVRTVIDGYDCGIRYMDGHIGQLLDAFRQAGVLDDLVIVVSSDHGENLGELGIYGEHGTADNITCRIPMLVRWPGVARPGSVDTGLHLNIDLVPTLAEMLNRPAKPYWDGRSFAATLRDGADTGREDAVISQCCHVCQRSVRWGEWLYVRTYHDGYHLLPQEMIFNIREDPHEQRDVAADHPELCREGAWRLLRWHDEMMQRMPAGRTSDPMQVVLAEGGPFHARGELKAYAQRLAATGREWALPELRRRHPREFEKA